MTDERGTPVDLERVLPELREPMQRAQVRLPRWLVRIAVRMLKVPTSEAVEVRRLRAGAVRLRVYRPRTRRTGAGLLWVHGGGLLFGDAKQDEALCLSTAERLGMVIVSPNYRLAPEHPFPAAHDDILSAWRWFLDHPSELGVDPARIAVGGESAGAGLAAGVVQRLSDEGGRQPCAQWLFAPMLDDRTAARRELDAERHFVWDNEANREGWAGFLGRAPGAVAVPPYAVPARRADLTGLPPTFLTWGDIELFAEEDRAYAESLRQAGVAVTTDVIAGAPHGFENWADDTPSARGLIHRAQDWLARATGATGPGIQVTPGVETTAAIVVTPALETDVAAVERLVREAYEPYVERIGREPGPLLEDYAAVIADGRALVARRDGAVVGLLILSAHPDHILVENVAVAESERGTGLGTRLLALADDRARAEGVEEVRLYTHVKMVENLAYYPRRGFVETARRTDDGFERVFFSRHVGPENISGRSVESGPPRS